ncbi:UNVERIFIED_CONTAM: gamma adaptin ear containing, arf binding protein [Gekko kuhli]
MINKATNPLNRQEDWEYIIGFCDQINKELEGPQIAVRLLAHKIQSPQEWEAIQALTVLEACMKNCGRRFHNEVGKFRFLNELIKVVSPKYLGDRVSEKVKTKIIELLYSWTVALPEESKIKDAYYMLKRQGIVPSDPVIPVERTLIPSPPPRPKNPVFDDEEKSKLLAKLLKSKNPDDLQEANKLIKSMVKEDEARIQKVTKRMHILEEVNNNVKLLNEMLVHYNKEDSSEADKELMKELFDRCETKRRTLFKLASETEDNDSTLGDILQASDNLSRVINSYKRIIEGQVINGEVDTSVLPATDKIPILPPPPQTAGHSRSRSSSQAEATAPQLAGTGNSFSLLDEELLCLGLNDPAPTAAKESAESNQWNMFQNEPVDLDFLNPKPVSAACSSAPLLYFLRHHRWALLMPCQLPLGILALPWEAEACTRWIHWDASWMRRKGSALPVTAYDKSGLRILLHFAKECPHGRPDVLVVVVSMLNTAPLPVKNIVLQAAVPKSMKVKLQPPSGTELAPFNPIQAPAAITQVMLLANPRKEKVRLRYRLTFVLGDQPTTEVGEVDQFPPAEQWGNL